MLSTEGLIVGELPTLTGHRLGLITLDAPDTLNSLTLTMIDAMSEQLALWNQDESIVLIVVNSTSEKAFSVGGDIRMLYQSMLQNQRAGRMIDSYVEDFFIHEYRLDYQLHCYAKPVLCWGNGTIMGGGFGVFWGGSHRVVTPNSQGAMPEITIGLFPDAGGTDLLAGLPGHLGLFLGLTGTRMNGTDLLELGIATHLLDHSLLNQVMTALAQTQWQGHAEANGRLLDDLLTNFAEQSKQPHPKPVILPVAEVIDRTLSGCASADAVIHQITTLSGYNDFFTKAIKTLNTGCPVSAGIIVEQLSRAAQLNLLERFQMEMVIAGQCIRHHNFIEGIRALIIDKDRQPKWQPGDLEHLPMDIIKQHFDPPWEKSPLIDLAN